MKFFFSEFPANYSQYHFPYQIIMQLEYKDDLARVYYAGFLPFRSKKNLYYLTRSVRINLGSYTPSSENRRIIRKMEAYTYTVQPIEQFEYTKTVQKICVESIKQINTTDNSTGKVMSTAAIRKLFTGQANCNYVMTFIRKDDLRPVGYAAIVAHENFIHYAHPFRDPQINDHNLNIGMLTSAVQWAVHQHKQHIFLGTCYTPGSLYKSQFTGFEFFNGISWSTNTSELKYLINRNSHSHLLQDDDYEHRFNKINFENTENLPLVRMKFK